MKTNYKYKIRFLIMMFLFTSIVFSNNSIKGKHKRSKSLHKEYTVLPDNVLNVNNKYGDIKITTWNKDFITIDVIITVTSSNESAAEQRFNSIRIDFDQDAENVHAKTIINKKKFSWNLFGSSGLIDTQINYQIKMPISNHIVLNNDYGGIFIDKLDGDCKLNCDYGFVRLGNLNSDNNTITMDYGNGSSIDFINKGEINIDYSELSIDRANELKVIADYTNIEIDNIQNLIFNNDYGSLKIKQLGKVKGNGDYLTLKVQDLHTSFDVNCDYGSIKIYKINNGFKKLTIDSKYTGVKIRLDELVDCDFDLSTNYSDIDLNDLNVSFTYKEDKMAVKRYRGSINNGSVKSKILIDSSYGSICLSKSKK